MQINSQNMGWSRALTFCLSALAVASGVYWVLKWPGAAVSPAAPVVLASAAPADPQALALLLGGGAKPVASAAPMANAARRFALTGVVAGTSHGGAALISVDGKPTKSYPVGSRVDAGLVLQSVAPHRAVLAVSSDGPAELTLEMKRPAK